MTNRRVRLCVTGKVQGVFFRQTLKAMAKKSNVSGWVRNLDDGRVETVLEGKEENVDSVVLWIRGGPANARVKNVEIRDEMFDSEFSKFDVLY